MIQFADNSYIEYTYNASGEKLMTQYGIQPGVGPLTPNGMGSTLYETNGTASPDSQSGLPSPDELTRVDYAYDDVREGGKYHEAHVRRVKEKDSQYGNKEDRRVVTGSERKTARANGEAVRYNHEGTPYVTISPISTKPLR